jgi:hypothetical protein
MTAQRGGAGEDLEQAVRAFEAALTPAILAGRHGKLEDALEDLEELRLQVVRESESLPRACWSRAPCTQCGGKREVAAFYARNRDAVTAAQFTTGRRLCPQCWGTGLTLNTPTREVSNGARRGQTPTDPGSVL